MDRRAVRARVDGAATAASSLSTAGGSGKPKQHIVTAVARERTGFVWAALTQ